MARRVIDPSILEKLHQLITTAWGELLASVRSIKDLFDIEGGAIKISAFCKWQKKSRIFLCGCKDLCKIALVARRAAIATKVKRNTYFGKNVLVFLFAPTPLAALYTQ